MGSPNATAQRARYESALARAHRQLWIASEIAEEMGDQGAEEDCRGLLGELTRLAEDSLRGKRRTTPMIGGTQLQLV